MSAEIGIAIVGTGFGQKVHIPGFQAHPRTRIVAVYHRDLAKAQAIAQTHHIPQVSDTLESIVALPEVQAVSISTPPFLHYEMATTVLQSRKHLLLEKPTTLSVTQAQQLFELAQIQQVATILNFEFRYVPAWQYFAELIGTNYVGQKRLIKIDWLVSSRADASRPWNWYARQAQGGGALGAIGSHAFDYIAWLFGPVHQLSARLNTAVTERPDPTTGQMKPVDADDTCLIMLELADGTPVQVCLSAATYQGRGHWVEVYGDRGTLVLGSNNQKDYVHGFKIWGSHPGEPLAELDIPARFAFAQTFADGRIAPFVRVVDRLIQSIDQHTTLAPSLQEGVYSQLLMDLAHESHRTGQWVKVRI